MQNGHYHITPIELNGSYSLHDLMAIIRENASQYFKRGNLLSNVIDVKNYIQSAIGCEDSECFGVLFMDNKHRLIEFEIVFYGTIDSTSVHPREVVKQALKYNAAAVILCHNHPSGSTNPSESDLCITSKLKEALGYIDIGVLDHIIVGDGFTSLAERGLMDSKTIQVDKINNSDTPIIPEGVEFFQVWEKTVIPEETYNDACSPKFLTEAEAKKYIEDNKSRFDGTTHFIRWIENL